MKSRFIWMASLSPPLTTLRHVLWMASLSPSLTVFCHLFQMASVSLFPILITNNVTSDECKFWGTLVFNHLRPSDHKRPTSQSTSSSLRRLNRGSCCTPKFSLSYFPKIFLLHGDHKHLIKEKIIFLKINKESSIGVLTKSFDWHVKRPFDWYLDRLRLSA